MLDKWLELEEHNFVMNIATKAGRSYKRTAEKVEQCYNRNKMYTEPCSENDKIHCSCMGVMQTMSTYWTQSSIYSWVSQYLTKKSKYMYLTGNKKLSNACVANNLIGNNRIETHHEHPTQSNCQCQIRNILVVDGEALVGRMEFIKEHEGTFLCTDQCVT